MSLNNLKIIYSASIVIKFNKYGNVHLLKKAFDYTKDFDKKYLVVIVTNFEDYEFERFLHEKGINHECYALVHLQELDHREDLPHITAEFDCNNDF